MNLDEIRDKNGKLPHYAWPGGYQILYLCEDDSILCPECVNDEDLVYTGEHHPDSWSDPRWHVVGQLVNWEGPPETCDHCNVVFASEYGEQES